MPDLICVMLATPYLENLKTSLDKFLHRPPTIYNQQRYLVRRIKKLSINGDNNYNSFSDDTQLVTKCIQLWGCILAISIVITIALLRYFRVISIGSTHWTVIFVELPICALLPMLPLAFPLMWIAINLWGIARLQTLMTVPQPNRTADDQKSFHEDLDTPTYDWENVPLPMGHVFWHWLELWRGDSQLLGRSANVVQVLGSITALCCVDKKGILSWPNPTAEKVFFIRDSAEKRSAGPTSATTTNAGGAAASMASQSSLESELSSDKDDVDKPIGKCGGGGGGDGGGGTASSSGAVAEVLDLTHDQHSAFRLEFDDHEWKEHISSLKPLGITFLWLAAI